jgi:hypothetical protein
MQEAPMDRDDRTADTGMVGSETQNPGPGRDAHRTDPAAIVDAEHPEASAAMSDADPDRTRLGSHEPDPAGHEPLPGSPEERATSG